RKAAYNHNFSGHISGYQASGHKKYAPKANAPLLKDRFAPRRLGRETQAGIIAYIFKRRGY
ncbi:MAG: hypothetical protein KGL10_05205, partial [Alphaproteobacteria bacterium]|nr:hypothetical protein [Alphaproteobacteria bacterium]